MTDKMFQCASLKIQFFFKRYGRRDNLNNLNKILNDQCNLDYISSCLKDPWKNTALEGYVFMGPKQKGEYGERIVEAFMKVKGLHVSRAHSSTAGYDRIIDGVKTEIKFSVACRDKNGNIQNDQFIINHISKKKDWERLIFLGINSDFDKYRMVWFEKTDFVKYVETEQKTFNVQQGGKDGSNDDYICTRFNMLSECSFVKDISTWK